MFSNTKMKITSCCGCCSLQTGSVIIGILCLVSDFFQLVSISIFASRVEYASNPAYREGSYFMTKAIIAGLISYVVLMLLITVFFVMGAVRKHATYVFPFLCVTFANIIISVAAIIGYLTYFWILVEIPAIAGVILFLIGGLCLTLQSYLWLVVFNFYKELVGKQYGHTVDNGGKIYHQKFENGV